LLFKYISVYPEGAEGVAQLLRHSAGEMKAILAGGIRKPR
jgi:hypothetical protein